MVSIAYSEYRSKTDLCDIHTATFIKYCKEKAKTYQLLKLENEIKQYFSSVGVDTLEKLISATPQKLQELKNHYDDVLTPQQQITIAGSPKTKTKDKVDAKLNLITLYDYFIKKDDTLSPDYNSDFLAASSDIFTCPYCNENYTYHYQNSKGKLSRTFDWDHVYPKEKYPFLAISFFNLVPSCKVCNFLKSNNNSHFFNPHSNINVDDVYEFCINSKSPDFLSNVSSIQLLLLFNKKNSKSIEFKNTFKAIDLRERLTQQKETIKYIFHKKRVYKEVLLESLDRQLGSFGLPDLNKESLKKTLWDVSFDHKEYYRKPFSKLTRDILKDIENKI